MRERLRRFQSSYWLLSIAFILAAVSMLPQIPTNCNAVHAAAANSPTDYCFQTDISISYAGVGTLTDQPVRIELPAAAMVSSVQLDERGWDSRTIQGSFANGIHMLHQETQDATAGNWVIVPSIDNTESEDFRMYTGQNTRRRDQSIWFTGGDFVTVTHDADFNISNNLDVEITLTNHSMTARNEMLVDKNGANNGYMVTLRDDAATLDLRFFVDNQPCDLTFDASWLDEKQDFRFEYISSAGNDAFIYRNGTLETSCDTDVGALGTTPDDLILGSNFGDTQPLSDGEIHSVNIKAVGVSAGYWEFRADHMEETSEVNPFAGTITDLSGNGHTGTYTFDRDQTDLTYTVSATQPINLSSASGFSSEVLDLLGGVAPDDAFSPGVEQTGGIFFDLFLDPLADLGPSRKIGAALLLTSLGLVMGIGVFLATKKEFMPVAVTIAAFPVWIGSFNGWVDWWYAATWAMIVLFTWWSFRRDRESA